MSNLYFISQLLYKRYGGNILVQLLGKWQARALCPLEVASTLEGAGHDMGLLLLRVPHVFCCAFIQPCKPMS